MMTGKNRILCTILTALLAVSMIGCGSAAENAESAESAEQKEPSQQQSEAVTETEEAGLPLLLPEDIDLDGRVLNVWFSPTVSSYNITVYEATGESVDDALVKQKKAAEELLNCAFTFYIGEETNINAAHKSYLAADNAYDFLNCAQYAAQTYVSQGIFYNFSDSEYIHLDSPWWNDKYIEESMIGGSGMYFLLGDMDLGAIRNSSALACNVGLLNEYDVTEDSLYDEVFAGSWTLDRFLALSSQIYEDINGNGQQDSGDVYGIVCRSCADIDHWLMDSGVRITARDGDGVPYYVLNNESTVNAIEKIYRIFWENSGMYYEEGVKASLMFAESRAAFMKAGIWIGESMRDADITFTVIPMPKLDESVTAYRSLIHDSVNVNCMLENTPDPEEICAVFEAIAYYGYQYVFPTYYEEALKVKYSHTDNSRAVQMIDLIHDSMTTDFAYIFNSSLGGIATDIGRELIGNEKSKNFASLYKENEDKYTVKLKKLCEEWEKNT